MLLERARLPRTGWAEAARLMRARDDDRLLDAPSSEFDKTWRWR
jgi:hypothetical protein